MTVKVARELVHAVTAACVRRGVPDVEVHIAASDEALTRFANNQIHQSVAEHSSAVSVRTVIGQRTARATTNRIERNGIEAMVEEAIALTRCSEADPGLPPLYEGGEMLVESRRYPATADFGPLDRARAVADAIAIVQAKSQVAAGIFAAADTVEVVANSRGVFCYYAGTLAQFSLTAMASDSSGWAKATHPDVRAIDHAALAHQAARKAELSADPKEIPLGGYTVILEPAAVLDLVGQIVPDFSATALVDQRSFLNDRLGEKIFGDNISIFDDVAAPLQTGTPFDGEGVPRQPLTLVECGVTRQVAYSRARAAKDGVQPTGHGYPLPNEHGEAPHNIVIAGGKQSVGDLIRSTPKGLLVTRLWYIREVEPYDKVMTGMTRDGTFLIRDGEIAHGIRNFRFNQSVVTLLNNVEAMSESVRSSGEEAFDMVVPGVKAHDFQFTEVTRF